MMNFSREERINLLDLEGKVRITDSYVVLSEPEPSGRATLVVTVDTYTIAFLNSDKQVFQYLRSLKCADGILLQQDSDGTWHLKIIEFKKNITVESLKKSIEQFEGALQNALVLMSFLLIEDVEDIQVYSAFRAERLEENPVLRKRKENRRALVQWEKGQAYLKGITGSVPYKKILLDQEGMGRAKM